MAVNVYEDNVGAIKLAKLAKLCPRTKHIALQYQHFCGLTMRGENREDPAVKIQHISTQIQEANIFTKPLACQQFQALRKLLCGW